jgi:2-polyprenyl-6-hydroxyphenyl methylase/3-demethylubiquinone-9 3-methyltransferase
LSPSFSLKWKLAQQLEYRWWRHYLRQRDKSKYLEWKKDYWLRLLSSISTHIEFPKNKTILDAGCGPAGIFMALDGNYVDALDPLLDKYRSLKHFTKNDYPWTTFITDSIESLDETGKYDLIFCLNAINHVNDIQLCYDKLYAALKKNGYLVISTDAHRFRLLKRIFQAFPGDALHPVQLESYEYDAFLLKKGFTILNNQVYKQEKIFNYHLTIAKK